VNLQCKPTAPNTGDYYADCVTRINQFRECACVPALTRWNAAESCVDKDAMYDSQQNMAHAGFMGMICSPEGYAQNECPGYSSITQIIDTCFQQMFDEGPGTDFSTHGHFINMTNTMYTMVGCGKYDSGSGSIWAAHNFQ
jgi:hypothetical protein